MTANIPKFIAEVQSRLDANGGKIPAALYFDIGKLCGMKCKEVVEAKKEHFAGKSGKKAATKTARKAAKKGTVKKTKDVKAPKGDAALVKASKKMLKGADESTGLVANTEDEYVWIASPEEISGEFKHDTAYVVDLGE